MLMHRSEKAISASRNSDASGEADILIHERGGVKERNRSDSAYVENWGPSVERINFLKRLENKESETHDGPKGIQSQWVAWGHTYRYISRCPCRAV